MLHTTWVRLAGGQLVRADRIVGVLPEQVEAPVQGRWANAGQVRVMVCLDVSGTYAEGDTASWWQEATLCARDRGDFMVVDLLTLIAAAAEDSGLRFIFPVVNNGRVDRWASGAVLPPIEGAALTGLPRLPGQAPTRA
ncbi:hypothetical protein [Streptomyces acidicola]|uniref:hypothetical protein n=1 Tax=Streptomyces acidicola TaxID=2596892 RepID=UPI00380FFD30